MNFVVEAERTLFGAGYGLRAHRHDFTGTVKLLSRVQSATRGVKLMFPTAGRRPCRR